MKRLHLVAAIGALSLSGCYNLVVINIGVANKSAAAVAAPFDLEAYCAALASHSISMRTFPPKLEQQAMQFCEEVDKKKKEKQ